MTTNSHLVDEPTEEQIDEAQAVFDAEVRRAIQAAIEHRCTPDDILTLRLATCCFKPEASIPTLTEVFNFPSPPF